MDKYIKFFGCLLPLILFWLLFIYFVIAWYFATDV